MYFDTHAHYDDGRFDADREAVLGSLEAAGVELVVNCGCDGPSSRAALALAERWRFLYAAVGWHPEERESWGEESAAELRILAAHEKAVAIGEIGLDYYWDKEHKAQQREMLERQLALALELDLPVIIHDREAHEDCLNAVSCFSGLRGVFHCYSGSAAMAELLLRDGWYLGFDGPVTYKNNRKAREVLEVTPLDRILLETDSPYLPPEPFRGQRNDSRLLPYIAARVAWVKGVETEELARIAGENGRRLFGLEGKGLDAAGGAE